MRRRQRHWRPLHLFQIGRELRRLSRLNLHLLLERLKAFTLYLHRELAWRDLQLKRLSSRPSSNSARLTVDDHISRTAIDRNEQRAVGGRPNHKGRRQQQAQDE